MIHVARTKRRHSNHHSLSGLFLPPEIDWLQEETASIGQSRESSTSAKGSNSKVLVIRAIMDRIRPFAIEQGGIIIAKGSAE